jgi:hypothetical protein
LLLPYQERRRILENNELSDVFVHEHEREMMGLFVVSLLTIGIMFAVDATAIATTIIYGQNSSNTGKNITLTLSCIRQFYSDKGYGEDVTEFCKK